MAESNKAGREAEEEKKWAEAKKDRSASGCEREEKCKQRTDPLAFLPPLARLGPDEGAWISLSSSSSLREVRTKAGLLHDSLEPAALPSWSE